jgi:serine/threonine-protein kinase HipA
VRKAEVYLHEKLAGHLIQNEMGYTFAYAPAYLATAGAAAVSLPLPLRSCDFISCKYANRMLSCYIYNFV